MSVAESVVLRMVEKYNRAGYLAFYHPRLKQISLGGGKRLDMATAYARMYQALKADNLL